MSAKSTRVAKVFRRRREWQSAEKSFWILEDGRQFCGTVFGADSDRVCEIVFNTSMVGYQEILSDPSYTDQAVVMTYPLIGNYGMAGDDYESFQPGIAAMIVREYNDEPSNFRSAETLESVMRRFGIVGVSGVDTRMLTRSIRDHGSRKALITSSDMSAEEGMTLLRAAALPRDAVSRVSTREIWHAQSEQERFRVVLIDCGVKHNLIRELNRRGCSVTVVPWNTDADSIRALRPDGILVSNGPGDPTDAAELTETLRALIGKQPIFGVCLGHQLISLAYGASTYKLKFGHRGGNHPVRNLETGRIEITSQNHSYAVSMDSLKHTRLTPTHINLLDGTVEGVKCEADRVFSVQFHPESAPGPQDSIYLFEHFLALMEEAGQNA